MRALGPILTIAVVLDVLRTQPGPGFTGDGMEVFFMTCAFVAGALGTQYRERGSRSHNASAVLLVIASVGLMKVQSNHTGYIALFVALFLLARRLPTRLATALSAIAVGFLVLAGATTQRESTFSSLLSALTIGGFVGLTMLTQHLREANEQAERRLDEFERTRAAETRAAALAERQHLAREMHDVLAHSLSGLMIQLEAARLLACQDGDDPRLPETIERAHRLGKSGLDEARRAIEMLRGDDLPGPDQLPGLARRCEENLGIPCPLTYVGEPHELSSEARLAVYRVAQEALTNVAKHARGPERVEMRLAYEPDGAELSIEDFSADLAVADHPSSITEPVGEGYGLTGMRERAELLGGTLDAGPTETGFRVVLKVPS